MPLKNDARRKHGKRKVAKPREMVGDLSASEANVETRLVLHNTQSAKQPSSASTPSRASGRIAERADKMTAEQHRKLCEEIEDLRAALSSCQEREREQSSLLETMRRATSELKARNAMLAHSLDAHGEDDLS